MTPFAPRAWQAQALAAWRTLHGVFCSAGVGSGKTWVGAQLCATGHRPLVLLPATALRQTQKMYLEYGVESATFCSYTKLQRAESSDFLETLRPDVLVLDEAHALRRIDTNSAARRIERYLVAHPEVRVAVLTASMQSRDLLDWGHLANWALRAASPVPRLRAARDALVERLARDSQARDTFRARLLASPGMVGSTSDSEYPADQVVLRVVRREPALVLPPTWETPSGYLIESAAHAAQVERQMAFGYYPDTNPRPSETYVRARRAWGGVVRRAIEQGLADTELQVRPLYPEQYALWRAAELAEGPLADPVAVWLTPLVLPPLPARPTLVWAYHRAVQEAAAHYYEAPLFREKGRSADGGYLPDYRGQVAVASIESCSESLNLQHFSHSLVLEPQADPEQMRQLIGRTARQGQAAPQVTIDFLVNCPAAERALRASVDRALGVLHDTGKSNPLLALNKQKDW